MEDNPFKLELILKLEKNLNLTYVSETTSDGRVSFAESEELRTEFITTFSAKNLQDYLFSLKKFEGHFEADLPEKNEAGFRFP
ncbi:MAG: hypothetical protein U1C58_13580 [Flavobacteriaceae bacterium]|nr:hypothetical protein [Flavobacteriaceae bacterium]